MLYRRDVTRREGRYHWGAGPCQLPPLGAAICRNPYSHTVVHEPVLMEFGGAWMIGGPGIPRR